MRFRRATAADIPAIDAIYTAIHDIEERGECVIGWQRGVYPTRATAEAAVAAGDMFVAEEDGTVVASARINREQVDVYAQAAWRHPAPPERVMVMHTLTVDPARAGRGYGKAFAGFYAAYALEHDSPYLRIDTNERNARARAMYRTLGYEEVSVLPCRFNGIEGVQLVCLEKKAE